MRVALIAFIVRRDRSWLQ